MKINIDKLRTRSTPVHEYIQEPSVGFERFNKKRREYKINQNVLNTLKEFSEKVVIFVFSAEWCPDCHRNVPILDIIAENTGIEVRVFGHIMKTSAGAPKKWAVPPSPEEVEEFNVIKIPYIMIVDKGGQKLGEIIENPPPGKTLEEAVLEILS
jgi:thiol-disulfide isomerase/thioredoxin